MNARKQAAHLLLLLLLFTPASYAAEAEYYVVKKGDSLWSISNKLLGDPWAWKKVWSNNPILKNPDKLKVGDRIRISSGTITEASSPYQGEMSIESTLIPETGYQPIPALSSQVINQFRQSYRFVTSSELAVAPYVESFDERVLNEEFISLIYTRGWLKNSPIINSYGVYRADQSYTDPATGSRLGEVYYQVAEANLIGLEEGVATLRVTDLKDRIQHGDRLFPKQPLRFQPLSATTQLNPNSRGKVVAVNHGMQDVGYIVAVNLGRLNGVQAGTVAALYQRPQLDTGNNNPPLSLPAERSGTLLFFQIHDKLSYGLVTFATKVPNIGDEIRGFNASGSP